MTNIKVNGSLLHVAVAVIIRDGHVLISKRAQNAHQGGLWEFPGGKVETGETVPDALSREIEEELGIHIQDSSPLIKFVHHYSDKSVLLDTLLVTTFDGKNYQFDSAIDSIIEKQQQLGLEGQVVKWVRLDDLECYPFPEANQAIIKALRLPNTYLITPDFDNMDQFIDEFSNSIQYHSLVQLRIKSFANNKERNQLIQQVSKLSKNNNVQLMANSSLLKDDIEFGCIELFDGIHLTSFDLHDPLKVGSIKRLHKQFSEKKIAASCHSMKDIEKANELKLDFIVVSAVKATTSHPNQKPLGWKLFKQLTDAAEMPVFALGGMAPSDIRLAQDNGAQGISAISSLWNMGEPCNGSEKFDD